MIVKLGKKGEEHQGRARRSRGRMEGMEVSNKLLRMLPLLSKYLKLSLMSLFFWVTNVFAGVQTIPVSVPPGAITVNSSTNRIYVGDVGNNLAGRGGVVVIDGATLSEIATIPFPQTTNGIFHRMATNPNSNKIYSICDGICDSLYVIDGATHTVSRVTGIIGPGGVAVNSDANKVYAAGWTHGQLFIINGAADSLITTLSVGSGALDPAVNPITNRIYVAITGDSCCGDKTVVNAVTVVDGATNTVITKIPVGSTPHNVAVNPITNRVYVAKSFSPSKAGSSNSISVIDGGTNTVIAAIDLPGSPRLITVDPDANLVYVPIGDRDQVVIIDGATNAILTSVSAGYQPQEATFDSGTGRVYVINLLDRTISVIGSVPPVLTLTLTGCTRCRKGDQFTVQAHVTNPSSHDVTVEAKFGVRLPDGTTVNLLGNEHLEPPLPAGMDETLTLLDLTVPDGLPMGIWSVEGMLQDPGLGETFRREIKLFEMVP